jgi:acetyl esterase/lipase
MSGLQQQFVALASPTAGRNGAGFHPCQGLFTRPVEGPGPGTAFIATHYNVDFSEHYLAGPLARRGYGFLGWNTRYRGNEAFFQLDQALIDIGVGVRWLRESAGIERIVLLGNSGGGSLMAAYQSQALQPNLPPPVGAPLAPEVESLTPGDAYVSLCAHRGRPEVLTDWLDPSVVDENDPVGTDATLSIFNPDNGPPFSTGFLERYRAAQVARNDRITAWAEAELERLAAAGMRERAFVVARSWADPRFLDPRIDPSNRPPGRCYAGDPRRANYGPAGLGFVSTLGTWLAMWSLRRSPCRGAPHLARITCPALVVQADADCGVFPSEARAILDALGSDSKRLETVAGDHYLQAPADARETVADLIGAWVEATLP